jgi:hypothetical protein
MTEELAGARQREAAAREILDLISRSRDDEAPVFDAILRRASDLCGAHAAALVMGKEGDRHQQMVASDGVDPATLALYDSGHVPMDPDISFAARAILTGKVVHVEDMMDTERYRRGDGLVFQPGGTLVSAPSCTFPSSLGQAASVRSTSSAARLDPIRQMRLPLSKHLPRKP